MHRNNVHWLLESLAIYITFLLIKTEIGCSKDEKRQPNIVIALADDLGWSDVGYHNFSGIQTPHIDKLARQGIVLSNHYVQPLCSPSRASLLTGKCPIHIGAGLNENVFSPDEEAGLPITETLLPEKLKSFGYATALFGKWHLGLAKKECLPTRRGFDRFYGFYTGSIDYYNHKQTAYRCRNEGKFASYLDLRDQENLVRDRAGEYSQSLFNEKALEFIDERDKQKPFFLLMSYQSVHDPLQVSGDYASKYEDFSDKKRQMYAGMTSYLDDSIHNLTKRIKNNGLWNDTLIIFMSDNGGNPVSAGYNWPLRGAKSTLWEGGIKSPTFLSGGFLKHSGFTSSALVHVSDWLPTLVSLAKNDEGDDNEYEESGLENNRMGRQMQKAVQNFSQIRSKIRYEPNKAQETFSTVVPAEHWYTGSSETLSSRSGEVDGHPAIDGVNVWKAITSVNSKSPRTLIIHNINNQSYAVRKGKWKLITEVDMGWAQPPEATNTSIQDQLKRPIDANTFKGYLLDANLPRVRNGLFDIEKDSKEKHDLSKENPEIVKELLKIIEKYKKTKVKSNRVYKCNLKALEKAKIENAWGPFLD